jgi:hypothetical protein
METIYNINKINFTLSSKMRRQRKLMRAHAYISFDLIQGAPGPPLPRKLAAER